jgi:TonB-dependent SusC/RagA subfamily outer membrane receptor
LLVWLLLLSSVAPALQAQAPGDSASSPGPAWSDRYVIDAAKLVRDGGARSLTDVLISQVPGLLVVPGSGLGGAGARIRFAGARSLIDDASPLILVDGLRIDAEEDASVLSLGGPGPLRLDDLPAEDIESVEVIRGPASGAIYGPGAASGVILIHTKRGRSGPARWEAYARSALLAKPSRWPANYGGVDLDNSDPWMRQGACTLTAQAAGRCVQDYVQTFNPLVERNPFASRLRRQVGFSGSGGPRWGAFRVAGAFDGDGAAYDVPALAPGDDYRRWNVGASGAIHPVPSLEVRGTVGVVSSDLRLPMYTPLRAAVYGPSDSAGFAWTPWFQGAGTQAVDRTSAVLQVGGRPLPWLELRGIVGLDDVRQREVRVSPTVWRSEGRRHAERRSAAFSAAAEDLTWRGLRFSTTIGIERLARRLADMERQVPDTAPACQAPVTCPSESFLIAAHTLGVYVLQEMALRERLVVTGALRRDRFDEHESAGGTHGSLAMAWLARPERAGPLGRVELRTAYGTAGRPFPDHLAFTVSPYPSREPLRPERTRAFELGADAKLLDGRWRGQVTYYALRSDVLDYGTVPTFSGFVFTFFNGAAISNRGVAATLIGSVVDRPALGWDLRLSVWGNRNRVVKQAQGLRLYGAPGTVSTQGDSPGYPTGGYWAPPIQSYADVNADGIIAPSEIVRSVTWAWVGTPYPTQGAALTSAWRVARRLRLSATLDYRAGQTLFNEAAWARCLYQVCREVQDPATPLADQATAVAALTHPPPAYFEDADYLKLRELWVAFELPPAAAAAVGARSATITLAGRDLLTWTSYSGADPESGSYGSVTTDQPRSVQDVGTVPVPRSWALRVRLSY